MALLERLKGERGTTLIEMMITISIMGIVAVASTMLVTGLFNSQARAVVMDDQLESGQRVSDFIGSKLSLVRVGQCGLTTEDGTAIEPTSIAGDQLLCHDDQDHCLRLMYLARLQQLQAILSNEGCDPIRPKRGPNEMVNGSYHVDDPADPRYDPVLDDPSAVPGGGFVFTLADDLYLDGQGSTDTEDQGLFSYQALNGNILAVAEPDKQAESNSPQPFYMATANLDLIGSVTINGYIDAQEGIGASVAPHLVEQTFYLNG